MSQPEALVVMRLDRMHKVHPLMESSRVCSRCGSRVGIYPSGQQALKERPGLKILCDVCAMADPPGIVQPAASMAKILQEMEDSQPAKR